MHQDDIERYEVYASRRSESPQQQDFKEQTGNSSFTSTPWTWVSLAVLLVLYPIQALIFGEDAPALLRSLNEGMRLVLLYSTVIMLWGMFLLVLWTTQSEKTPLRAIGFTSFRPIYIAWAIAFVLMANLILSGLAWTLAQVGLPMPGEIGLLIPESLHGKILWVFVAITAGVCEETAFRGYLMTRLRMLHGLNSWVVPTILSSLAFGICHSYQGIPGLIVITTYGLMFSLLYIRTGSLWPCIIAHFFQDFSALFIPQ